MLNFSGKILLYDRNALDVHLGTKTSTLLILKGWKALTDNLNLKTKS